MPQEGDPDKGAVLYEQKCAKCHGSAGESDSENSLRGCSVCDSYQALFEKIEYEMPQDNPEDCTGGCAYDTAAFICLYLNGHEDDGGCFISLSGE